MKTREECTFLVSFLFEQIGKGPHQVWPERITLVRVGKNPFVFLNPTQPVFLGGGPGGWIFCYLKKIFNIYTGI